MMITYLCIDRLETIHDLGVGWTHRRHIIGDGVGRFYGVRISFILTAGLPLGMASVLWLLLILTLQTYNNALRSFQYQIHKALNIKVTLSRLQWAQLTIFICRLLFPFYVDNPWIISSFKNIKYVFNNLYINKI